MDRARGLDKGKNSRIAAHHSPRNKRDCAAAGVCAKEIKTLLTRPTSLEMLINPVAVEKLVFCDKSQKSVDRKCLGDWEKSFVVLPDANRFLQISSERVLQQPLRFPRNIKGAHFAVGFDCSHHHLPKGAPF